MDRMTTLRPIRTGSSAAVDKLELAAGTSSRRMIACQPTSALAGIMGTVSSLPATVDGLRAQNRGSPVNRRSVDRIMRNFAGTYQALVLGMALLIASAWSASASTLVFTFADDGTDSTITPSGSLPLTDLGAHRDLVPQVGPRMTIDPENRTGGFVPTIELRMSKSSGSRRVYGGGNAVSTTFIGSSSYTGNAEISNISQYTSPIYFEVDENSLQVDTDHISASGDTYEPTDWNITFAGTLLSVLGDDEFHIEAVINDSLSVIFTTAGSVPAMPKNLAATQGDGQTTLSWDEPENSSITKYEIQQKEAGGDFGAWVPIDSSGANTTSHTIDGLTNGTEYTFRIRAINFHGDGGVGETEVTPLAAGTPEAAKLTATAGTRGTVLKWTHAGDSSITGWQFQRREGEEAFGAEWTDIPGSNAETRQHAVGQLTGGVAHVFRIRAVNDAGVGANSNEVTTTPSTQPPVEMEKQVLKRSLAAVGQATLAGVTNVIDQRLQSTPGTSTLMLGGQSVAAGSSRSPAIDQQTDGWWSGNHVSESFNRPVDDAGMLDGSAFTLSLSGDDADDSNRGWTIWGRGDYRSFEGMSGKDSWDGSAKSVLLGFDTRASENLLAGLAVSRSRSTTDLITETVGSRVETSLTAAWPYMQTAMPDGSGTIRVVLGIGSGDAKHHSDDGEVERAGLSMTAASVGTRLAVAQQGQVALSVPVTAEVIQLKTDGDGTTAIGGLSVKSWRASGGVEATHSGVPLSGSNWILTPRGSVSFRWDGGDGVTGKGIEVGGGFGLHAPDSRVSLDASGHWLATHSDDNQREWGASIGVQIAPDSQGHGWSASLRQEWGLQQAGVLSDGTLFQNGASGAVPAPGSLAARAGYGFGIMEGLMTLSADARLATGDEEVPHYGAGLEFALPRGLTATLRGEHVDTIDPDTRIGAGVHLNF